jgi:HK97 family phage major capsid protein
MKNLEIAKKLIHDAALLRKTQADQSQVNELVKTAIEQQMKALGGQPSLRKGQFNLSMANAVAVGGAKGQPLQKALLSPAGKADDAREFQKMSDTVYITSVLVGCHPTDLECYKMLRSNKLFKDAYSSGDFDATWWWPDTLSRDMIEEVEKELKVAALHRTIQMPTNPYKIPAKSGRTKTYLVGESTDDAGTKPSSSKGPTPGTGITFDAKKLMAYSIVSEETSEDMVLPIIDLIKEDVGKSMAEAIETAVLNGQIVAETIDTAAAYAANDSVRAWNGYRVHALGGGWTVDFSGWTKSTAVDLMRKLRATMGRYAVGIDKLAWLVSINGYNHLLNTEEMLTLDKYGANATLLKGELGRFDNIPIIITEFLPENLNASGAYTSDVDNDNTCVLLVYKDGWVHGERASFTVKQGEEIKTDQKYLISRARRDFQPLYMGTSYSQSIVAAGYGLPNTL